MGSRHLVISYDVTDDRIRARLAKRLRGYVDRVQKSVFEGPVEEGRLEDLRAGIRQAIDQEADSVRVYSLCARCQGATEIIGTGVYVEREEGDVIV
ncbi:MAG: CRISPR-associated endonuclease Cas2 [Candidatus Rokubacteria bacterium]|nr:CRISPR-associated endonuclease Cas2 [Candidatus Rokubacteria bacterium]